MKLTESFETANPPRATARGPYGTRGNRGLSNDLRHGSEYVSFEFVAPSSINDCFPLFQVTLATIIYPAPQKSGRR